MEKVFAALSDANRRRVVELLHESDSTLLELHKYFSISFQALSKHINILADAELLIKEKKGKYKILSLNRNGMKPMLEWISYYSDFWNKSFDKLDDLINNELDNGKK